jgi:hypothetical protein
MVSKKELINLKRMILGSKMLTVNGTQENESERNFINCKHIGKIAALRLMLLKIR